MEKQPFTLPELPDTTAFVRRLAELMGIRPSEPPIPPFDAPDEIRDAIREKIKRDVHPDLWNLISYHMLAKRWEEVPELVENLLFGYLVKVQCSKGPVFSGDMGLPDKIWSMYFKRISEPEALFRAIAAGIRTAEGELPDPSEITVIEILPNIPFQLWKGYQEGLDIEDVRVGIEMLPEV